MRTQAEETHNEGLAGTAGAPIRSGADYIESLRNRDLKVYLFGELALEPVDHPMIRPSINAVAETYDLALSNPDLATATSPFTGGKILRLIENMTLGRNAVGYLTESLHGAGSPQAQRIQIARSMKLEDKNNLAKRLAGIKEREVRPPAGAGETH